MITGLVVGQGQGVAVQCSAVQADLKVHKAILLFFLLHALGAAFPAWYFCPDGSWGVSPSKAIEYHAPHPSDERAYVVGESETNGQIAQSNSIYQCLSLACSVCVPEGA